MSDHLSSVFQALADPTRRAILARLNDGEASVQELADPFEISQPAVSKHLKVLEDAGLVEVRKDAQRRPRRLRIEPLLEVQGWVSEFQRRWDERFARLDALLEEEAEQAQNDPPSMSEEETRR